MKPWNLLPLLAALLLASCGELSLAIEQPTGTAPVTAPTALLSQPSPTPLLAIPSLAPPAATAAIANPTPAIPQATGAPLTVKIFMIAVDDQGKSGTPVGCGDSAAPVEVQIPHTQAVLKAALEALLAVKQQNYGESGLYNALYQSDLKVDSLDLQDGKATVNLSGTLILGGECDNPRVEAQLTQTVRQFSTVSDVAIFINGKALKDVLSLK
jgi:hypothetical protein